MKQAKEKTMSKYILTSVAGDSVQDMDKVLKENICFPLVRELEFKYGLKVYKISGEVKNVITPHFYMCISNGLRCGAVFAKAQKEWDAHKGTHVEHWEYNFKTPYYKKARGSSDSDRETISSKKISTLMGTIQRQKVIKPLDEIINKEYKSEMLECLGVMKDSFGKDHKYAPVDADTIHALVAYALGENPNSYGLSINKSVCKDLLDKFNKCDSIRAEKLKETERFFSNPFYAIGVDKSKHIIIGKLKIVENKMQVVEDFSRVLSLDHKEDLTAILTMMRVANENMGELILNCFPNNTKYDANLDVIYKSVWYRNETDFHWTLIPCQ